MSSTQPPPTSLKRQRDTQPTKKRSKVRTGGEFSSQGSQGSVATSDVNRPQDTSPFEFASYAPTKQHLKFDYLTKSVILFGISSRGQAVSLFKASSPGIIQNVSIVGVFESAINQDFDRTTGTLDSTYLNYIIALKPLGYSVTNILQDLAIPTISDEDQQKVVDSIPKGPLFEPNPDFFADMTKSILDGTGSCLTSRQINVHDRWIVNPFTSARKIQVTKGDEIVFICKSDSDQSRVNVNARVKIQFIAD